MNASNQVDSNASRRILLVCHEAGRGALIRENLASLNDIVVIDVKSLSEAQDVVSYECASGNKIDLVLFGLDLIEGVNPQTLFTLRACDSDLPLLVLTSRTDQSLDLDALTTVADGYLEIEHVDAVALDRAMQYAVRHRQVLRRLNEGQDRFEDFARVSSDWLWEMDADLRINYHSGRLKQLTGLDTSDVIGKRRDELGIPGMNPELWADHLADLKAHRRFQNFRYAITASDGRELHLSVSGMPKFDQFGKFQGYRGSGTDITEQVQQQEDLSESESSLRAILSNMQDIYYRVDHDGLVVMISDAVGELLGFDADDLIGKPITDLYVDPEERQTLLARLAANQGRVSGFEVLLQRKDKNQVWVSVNSQYHFDAHGQVAGIEGTVRDVTKNKQLQDKLKLSAAVYEKTTEAIVVTDTNGIILDVNPAFTKITGYSRDEAVGRRTSILSSGRHPAEFYHAMWQKLSSNDFWQGEIWNRRKNGELYPEWLSISALYDEDEKVDRYVALFSDISKLKENEERILYQANYDVLTDLPNRMLFMDRLGQTVMVGEREGNTAALMFIDLDNFKIVNDTLGHAAGDELLKVVAERLSECVRAEDSVARLGGDEFTVILPNISQEMAATVVADKILKALSYPIQLGSKEVHVGASIGITLFPRDGKTPAELLQNADTAMYRAKEQGRNMYQFYTQELQTRVRARMEMESDLRSALEHDEFHLHYQPFVNVATRKIVGAEVLLRWNHPTRGNIPPLDFIPLAEDTGLIQPIGSWILDSVCGQIASWDSEGVLPPRMAINMSVRQFQRNSIVEDLRHTLERTGIAPERLEMEITETLLAEDTPDLIETLNAMKDMGLKLSIDDFGTGYSSLAYLKRFPIDTVKIDKAFVTDMTDDPDNASIVRAIVAMAHNLNLKVIAEGVEQVDQFELLEGIGCDMAQGFLLGRPMEPDDFRALLRGERELPLLAGQ